MRARVHININAVNAVSVRRLAGTLLVGAMVAWAGCKKLSEPIFPDVASDTIAPQLSGVGESCKTSQSCRPGLTCGDQGECEPAGTQAVGQACVIGPECAENMSCGPVWGCFGQSTWEEQSGCRSTSDCDTERDPTVVCAPRPMTESQATPNECQKAGETEAGRVCTRNDECVAGLYCQLAGLVGLCAEAGGADYGQSCAVTSDCFQGLVCGPGDTCMYVIEALDPAHQWSGADCDTSTPENPRAYFEVPGPSGVLSEFYRLPFPNDIRMRLGKVTAGHPTPGRAPLDFDPVQRVLDAVDSELTGFGTSPTIFFRFSTRLDFDSVDYSYDDTEPNLRVVNIDPDSPQYKQPRGYVWGASEGRSKYLCGNWLTLKTHAGDPLPGNTTYAALMMKGLRACAEPETDDGPACAPDSPEFAADADFQAMLTETAPADARLKVGWEAYAKLRQYLKDAGIAPSDVISAAVFTTVDVTGVMSKARAALRTLPVPEVSEAVLCGPGVESPCADPNDSRRVCNIENPQFYEIQGKIGIPIYQEGTAPYLNPEDGGRIKLQTGGVPQIVRTEPVCFSLTIPKGVAPAEGWPVVMVAHGTGGTFRNAATDGLAQLMASADASATGAGIATLTIDGVMHGPRRNSDLDPEHLFFNFANPAAARGNVMQGAIDYMALTYWLESYSGALAGLAVDFDATKLGFLGHSQGATIGGLFAAFEPSVGPVVLSGAGAGLVKSVLHKTSPVDVGAGVSAALRETADEGHPVLSLLQQLFDEVDNVNYARLLTAEPPDGFDRAHDLLIVYGQGDTYTPPETTRLLVDVLKLDLVAPALDVGPKAPFDGYQDAGKPDEDRVVEPPLEGNLFVAGQPVTAGVLMAAPTEGDGHFVMFTELGIKAQVQAFFASRFKTGVAQIIAP